MKNLLPKGGAPVILFLLVLAFMANSCKKDLAVSQTTPLTQKEQIAVVDEAKTWFQRNEAINKPSVAINDAGSTRRWYDGLNPGWENTIVYEKDKGTVIEMPLLNSAVAFLMNTTDGSKASLQTNYTKTTYLIQKDSVGVFKGWFMVLIADTTYINGDFSKLDKNTYQKRDPAYSGRLMYFDINGKFAGGWRYQNGAITQTLTLTNATTTGGGPQINSEKPKAVNTVGCITKTVTTVTWACVGSEPTSPPKWNASVRTNSECVAYVTVKNVEECTYGGGGGSNNTPGSNGNPGFPAPIEQGCKSLAPASVDGKHVNLQPLVPTNPDDPCLVKPIDCAGVSGGSAYLATCGCIGGTTGVPTCPPLPKIIMDSLLKNFPCAVKLILNNLLQDNSYTSLVAPFITSQRPNLVWEDGALPWAVSAANSTSKTYTLGETHSQASGIGQSATITLNTKMLQNSSELLIAATMIHETIHAYINYGLVSAQDNAAQGYTDFSKDNWLLSIDQWCTIDGLPANYSNHLVMLTSYFDQTVNILKTWDKGAHSDDQYAMAMLYGLNTSDPTATAAQTANLQQTFDAIKVKYSLTDAKIIQFNQKSVLSTTEKLPGTCN